MLCSTAQAQAHAYEGSNTVGFVFLVTAWKIPGGGWLCRPPLELFSLFFVCFEAEGTGGCAGTVVQELLFFFPFRSLAGFSVERRWRSRQGPVAAAALALAGWPAASARALCHRPGGSYGHQECRSDTGEATAHMDWAFCCDLLSFLAGGEPLELQTELLHAAPEKPTCAVLRARKEHMQILQMSKYLNLKTNEG